MKKAKKIILSVQRPNRDPDYWSKRSVPYWWAPEWIRGTSGERVFEKPTGLVYELLLSDGRSVIPCQSYGKIYPVKEKDGEVNLYMRAKDGNLTFIQGSIQKEFRKWFIDRSIDYLLFGMDPNELIADAE
jgi:hypothetical protein